ncbi:MAG: hypothetical protein N2246_10815, partial [Candidatus Sumerlaeia bacterium]|nr:hypothetical protein [Candidatus Sumerlaeia bacterium]
LIDIDKESKKIYDSLPIRIINKTEYDWFFVFLPYVEKEKEYNYKKYTLPPLIHELRIGDVEQQHFLIGRASKNYFPEYLLDIYWGREIDVNKFRVIAIGWEIRGIDKVSSIDFFLNQSPNKIIFLKNENYKGMKKKDYEVFGTIVLSE